MEIRAVLFDVGGVLEQVDDRGWLARFARRVNMQPEEFTAVLERDVDPDRLMEVGRMSESEYQRRVGEAFSWSATDVDDFMAAMWEWYRGALDEQMLDFARKLRPRWRTAILSNSGDGARREEERRYRFSSYFHPIVYSHAIGVAKPDPRAYEEACTLLSVPASEVLFIDDLRVNVDAASALGMTEIPHTGADSTIAAARRLLNDGSGD